MKLSSQGLIAPFATDSVDSHECENNDLNLRNQKTMITFLKLK